MKPAGPVAGADRSPLAEGRELKFLCLLAATVCVGRPSRRGVN